MKEVLLMNRTLCWISVGALALSLAACGKSNDTAKTETPPPPKETVFDGLIATKARAKQQTEQAMEANKEKLDAAMKSGEENSAPQ
jgi:hypothetical protein